MGNDKRIANPLKNLAASVAAITSMSGAVGSGVAQAALPVDVPAKTITITPTLHGHEHADTPVHLMPLKGQLTAAELKDIHRMPLHGELTPQQLKEIHVAPLKGELSAPDRKRVHRAKLKPDFTL